MTNDRLLSVILVLDNLRSMHNVGSLFRTADAFGLECLYLCGITATPPHREIHRTALGATESVAWRHFGSAREAVQLLKEQGYQIIAIEQTDKSIPLAIGGQHLKPRFALVFGNEVNGISGEVLEQADLVLEIPQFGIKHSLNVSVTAGIVIWELTRGRIEKSLKK
ncbi:MAG: RNA methyltransferase [bacterium]